MIDFKDIRKVQVVLRIFCVVLHYLYFLILPIYRHSCIVYLQGMTPRGVFTWLLVSLVVCLKCLHGQSSVSLAPQAIVASCMGEDLVTFKPLSQI